MLNCFTKLSRRDKHPVCCSTLDRKRKPGIHRDVRITYFAQGRYHWAFFSQSQFKVSHSATPAAMSQRFEQDDFRDDMFKERRRNPLVLFGECGRCWLLLASRMQELLSSEHLSKPSIALLQRRSGSYCRSLVCWTLGIQAGKSISCLLADYIYAPVLHLQDC